MSKILEDLEQKLFDNGMGKWEITSVEDYTITLINMLEIKVDSKTKIHDITLHLTRQHTDSFIVLSFTANSVAKKATIKINNADESLLWPTSIWTHNIEGHEINHGTLKALELHLNETIKTINFFEP